MEQIGFSVVDAQGNELQHWGDAPGAIVTPDRGRVVWPNGDITEGVSGPVDHGDWRFVPRMCVRGPSGVLFDGTQVVVSIPVQPQEIKAEAQRRIVAMTGATDLQSCIVKQLNALMRATELANKQHTSQLTEAEQAEAAQLQLLADTIKAVRAKSNEIEQAPPSDFTDDAHWQ